MFYKILLWVLLLFSAFSFTHAASISDIQLVKSDGSAFEYDLINRGEIPLKYILSDNNNLLFQINGEGFVGFDIAGSLRVVVDRDIFEAQVFFRTNTEEKIFFRTTEIRNLVLNNSKKKSFQFEFCPTENNVRSSCVRSETLTITDDTGGFNDTYSHLQYYLEDTKINDAKKRVSAKHTPVIAVIDDGVSINHADLRDNIWRNTWEIQGNGIDDDGNGFVDDFNGWNFVDNNSILAPKWTHGTNVASIIGATSGNNFGITGVVNDLQIMPIITCSSDGGCGNVATSIKYAVDNGADIINLSLWGQWFGYDTKNDAAIQYAVERGVIVVIAGGNGDQLLTGQGIDTTLNKIGPVCNERSPSDVIGVSALSVYSDKSENGQLTSWSNFWACTDISAYGESIVALNTSGGYSVIDGTSFSAPIITGVIGLGFNAHGRASNQSVHTALLASKNKWLGIDAIKYVQNISKEISKEKTPETENQQVPTTQIQTQTPEPQVTQSQNKYISLFRKRLGNKLEPFPTGTLIRLTGQISDLLERGISGNIKLKVEALDLLIREEISSR